MWFNRLSYQFVGHTYFSDEKVWIFFFLHQDKYQLTHYMLLIEHSYSYSFTFVLWRHFFLAFTLNYYRIMKRIERKLVIINLYLLLLVLIHSSVDASVNYCAIEEKHCATYVGHTRIRVPHIGCNETGITFRVSFSLSKCN